MISLPALAKPICCKRCGSEFPVDMRRRYCEPCASAPKVSAFVRVRNCGDCGVDISERHFLARFCWKCSSSQNRRRKANYTNGQQKNDNDLARQVTNLAVRIGF